MLDKEWRESVKEDMILFFNDAKDIYPYFKEHGLVIEHDELGKPFIVNQEDKYISISYMRREGAGIAIISDVQIGIDIEQVRLRYCASAAKRLFTPDELDYVADAAGILEQERRYLEIWTRKEARLKCDGVGLNGIPNDFSVLAADPDHYYITTTYHDYIISICATTDLEINLL